MRNLFKLTYLRVEMDDCQRKLLYSEVSFLKSFEQVEVQVEWLIYEHKWQKKIEDQRMSS